MREIKFRGMTRKKGEKVRMDGTPVDGNWVYGGVKQGEGDFSIIYENETYEKRVVYTDTVCQYIGLNDKNGKEIYEGDILEWQLRNGPSVLYECVWLEDECAFAFNDLRNRRFYENPVDCNDDYTLEFNMGIIGNKFDNPELLERGAK